MYVVKPAPAGAVSVLLSREVLEVLHDILVAYSNPSMLSETSDALLRTDDEISVAESLADSLASITPSSIEIRAYPLARVSKAV